MNIQTLDCLSIEGYSIFDRVAFFIDNRKKDTESGEIKRMYSQLIEGQRLEQRAVILCSNNIAFDIPLDLILLKITE